MQHYQQKQQQMQLQKKKKVPVEFPSLPCLTKGLAKTKTKGSQKEEEQEKDLYRDCLTDRKGNGKENKEEAEEKDKDPNQLKPGWIQLIPGKDYRVPETPYDKKRQQQKQEQNTPHYIMSQTARFVSHNRSRHIQQHDALNGHNAYAERYVTTPTDSPDDDEGHQNKGQDNGQSQGQGQHGQRQQGQSNGQKEETSKKVKWFTS